MKEPIARIKDFFSRGHERSLKAKKNILFSFFIKCGSVLTTLLVVPLTISYVNPTQYGVWLTLSSLFTWFTLFDVGFGNGLKNKLTQALAEGNERLAKIYVSTTYYIVALISIVLFGLFLAADHFLDWARVLNTPAYMNKELGLVVLLVFAIFSLQFIFQLLNIICLAKQNTVIPSLINFAGNITGLLLVFIFTRSTHGSLLYLCFSIGISPLLALLVFTIVLYTGPYKKLAPSFRLANFGYARDIMDLGLKFFIIQIGLIFYYNCDNLIIAQLLGPEAVTPYNIAFKYFGVISILTMIIITPFWSAFTDAHIKQDYSWIKNTVKRLEKICFMLFGLSLVMLLISPYIYHLWLGGQVHVPFSLSAVVCFYTVLLTYRSIFSYYMNGTGKIMLQVYLVIISGIINIPLAIFLGKWLGSTGVLLSTTLLSLISAFFEVVQYKKLISHTATGIWNK